MTWWRYLNTPNKYLRDWYGWLTNQAGHTLYIGLAMPVAIFLLWFAATGDMPYRWVVAGVVVSAYICVEQFVQGGLSRDSITDAWFVAIGATATTQPWEMVATDGARYVDLRLDTWWLAAIVAAWAATVFWGTQRRYKASLRHK